MLLSEVKKIFEEATEMAMPSEDTYTYLTLEQINRLVHAITRNVMADKLEKQIGS